ncbi:hypothetical protein BDB00DRAFT_870545 [Zychaea mexicana]|uniref:uncharacterized protein n=1 Tax=Zychaea mexicana TaxID=64656 RepID=UPI0022FDE6C3|nr:uncharacterized protein BDB00DRAFT_870545 [Zychaea mexicana]KAI9495394.1 hypothetical protein BDB00DRAFT_870545 [Zychaea mexicana]
MLALLQDLGQWILTDFDIEYVKHHPSATTAEAHDSLANEIVYMKRSNVTNRFVLDKLNSLERALAKAQSDKINKYFWKNCKKAVCTSAVDERVATYQTEVGVSKCLALAIEKRAKELELAFPKRAHDAVEAYSDDENSDAGSMSSGEYRSRRPKKQKGNKKKGVKPVTRTIALTDSDANGRYEMKNPVFN